MIMKKMKVLSAALSLTLGMTACTGILPAFAADDAGSGSTAAVQTAVEQKVTFDEILELGTGITKLRRLFNENGLLEEKGYKLWIREAVRDLLEQNRFPAILLNAEKIPESGEGIGIPQDQFSLRIKTVETPAEDGRIAQTYRECALVPTGAAKLDDYVTLLTAMLNYMQFQPAFEGFAYENVFGRFYGTDDELSDCYKIPGLHGIDVIRQMTTGEIEKLFAARALTAEKGYQVWTDESVSALLESGKFPAVVLYPEQIRVPQEYVDALIAEAENDPDTTVLADQYNVIWDLGWIWDYLDMPDHGYYLCWKTLEAEPGTYAADHEYFCEVAYVPLSKKDYSTYVSLLKNALNYVQTTALFAGFRYEALDEPFYGQSKLLDEGYMLPGRNRYDVIRMMTTEEVEDAFRQDGKTEDRGNKVYTAADVLAMLEKGEFPSVITRPECYNVGEYEKGILLAENPDSVFCEDQGMCWSYDRFSQFTQIPLDQFTLKVKTIVENPPPEYPNAVKDYYAKWVIIPKAAANMEAYAKAVADVLNIVQIYGEFLSFDTEKMDADFYGSETVPENQYLLPAGTDSVQLLPVTRISAGDVNDDGSADVADAVLIARYLAEDAEVRISEKGMAAADVDGSGRVTPDDVTVLLQRIAKQI